MATSLCVNLRRPAVRYALVAVLCVAAARPALAGPRARLSADLRDALAAGSQTINVIVHGDQVTVDTLAARYNVLVKRYLRNGAVLRANAGQLAALQADQEIDHLSGDARVHSAGDVTAESIGADYLWRGMNDMRSLSGAGVSVAIIDSGIDPQHHALKKRVVATIDFTGGNGEDRFGHGTHVAAIIAGARGRTSDTREYRGIASSAFLLNLRVLGADGSGKVSNVVDAIDWAVAHRRHYNIRVINLSLGGPVLQPYGDDPLCEAIEHAVRAGIVVITAAGNVGQTQDGGRVVGGVTSPGNSPYAITVGALDTHGSVQRSDDTVAPYSSSGPTRYDVLLKPDLVAPGSRIVSAEVPGSYLSQRYPARHVAGAGPNAYLQLSGTSMAAAVVSGTVALLLEERVDLTPAMVKAVLQRTSTYMPSAGLIASGAGSLNALAAAEFVETGRLGTTTIAGEQSEGSDLIFLAGSDTPSSPLMMGGPSIIWNGETVDGNSIVWGRSIVWGALDSIVWGSALDSIVWGSALDSIVWGSALDSIVWGSALDAMGGSVD